MSDERLVPVLKSDWGFFDRQRALFSESHKDFDDESKQFEDELEQMKRDMFTLTPLDLGAMAHVDNKDMSVKMEASRKTESSVKQTTTRTTISSTSSKTSSTTATAKTTTTATASKAASTAGAVQPVYSTVLNVQRPFITDIEGNKKLALRFDVSKFKPEEITVKTVDKTLTVHAKHVEESPGKKVYREFTKSYTLPKPVDPLLLTSTLSTDGVLHIEAPTPLAIEAPREVLIPITRM